MGRSELFVKAKGTDVDPVLPGATIAMMQIQKDSILRGRCGQEPGLVRFAGWAAGRHGRVYCGCRPCVPSGADHCREFRQMNKMQAQACSEKQAAVGGEYGYRSCLSRSLMAPAKQRPG